MMVVQPQAQPKTKTRPSADHRPANGKQTHEDVSSKAGAAGGAGGASRGGESSHGGGQRKTVSFQEQNGPAKSAGDLAFENMLKEIRFET